MSPSSKHHRGHRRVADSLADNGTSAPTAHERFLELPFLVPRQAATLGSWLAGDATATTTMSAQTTTGKTVMDVANEIAAMRPGRRPRRRATVVDIRLQPSPQRHTNDQSNT